MVDPTIFIKALRAAGVSLFAGVPDSLLLNFVASLSQPSSEMKDHIISANEGNAIGLAIGHFLATGDPALVYMQNSGLGNAINPIASLADPEVYGIPMILLIGWRGEPGSHDEPQHVKQGKITEGQLNLMDIPYWVLDANSNIKELLDGALETMTTRSGPVALLVRAGAFGDIQTPKKFSVSNQSHSNAHLLREIAIKQILNSIHDNDIVIVTTGKAGRELFELRKELGLTQRAFLTVGGMGHASSIALGVALAEPGRRVICLDGDGAMLMHLGALAIIGDIAPKNLIHVLLNNRSHESVGGQPTVAGNMRFEYLSKSCNYLNYSCLTTEDEIYDFFSNLGDRDGPLLCEILLSNGSRSNLGRPTVSPNENKIAFMNHITPDNVE